MDMNSPTKEAKERDDIQNSSHGKHSHATQNEQSHMDKLIAHDKHQQAIPHQKTHQGTEIDLTVLINPAQSDERQENVSKTGLTSGTEQLAASNNPYSTFSHRQKKMIISAASVAAFVSPLSSQIYLPALEKIAEDLNISNSQVNLTVTMFLIFQGIAPTFMAAFSDERGRRPAYFLCFPTYIGANIGLALSRNYASLMVLRCLQSSGSSGTVSLSNAIVADMVTSAERGTYIGFAQIGTILGPAIGPIIGGLISQYLGWPWIFWFLTILSVAIFLPLLLFMPETCRNIVGDGSLRPPVINRCLTDIWAQQKKGAHNSNKDDEKNNVGIQQTRQPNRRKRWPNPFSTLVVMTHKPTALLLFCNGVAIACYIAVTVSIPAEFQDIYNFNQLETSLVYLPISFGSVLSAFTTGRLLDWNYRRYAKALGYPLVRNRQHNLTNFPIENARLQIALPLTYVAAIATILYGWVLHLETSVAGPIILLVAIGYAIVAAYQVTAILLVDFHPGRAAAATAANNLVRCLLSAAASAVANPLLNAMGRGWTYTFFALLLLLCTPSYWVLIRYGPKWRKDISKQGEKQEQIPSDDREKCGISQSIPEGVRN